MKERCATRLAPVPRSRPVRAQELALASGSVVRTPPLRQAPGEGESLPACKPGSVEASSLGRSFLSERRRRRPLAAYPRRLNRSGQLLAAYSALLRLGFAMP